MRKLSLLLAILLAMPPAMVNADVKDGQPIGTGEVERSKLIYGSDGASYRVIKTDATGKTKVVDGNSMTDEPNMLNNGVVNDYFKSPWIDAEKFGGKPFLMISWPGTSEPLYVAVDWFDGSVIDSTTIFRAKLGGSNPNIAFAAGSVNASMRTLGGAAPWDTTSGTGVIARSSFCIPLWSDSTGSPIATGKGFRVIVQSDGSTVPGVYMHAVGKRGF